MPTTRSILRVDSALTLVITPAVIPLFGTINFWDTLEFFYWLTKTDYDGWMHIDFVSPRDDRIKMFKLAIKFIRDYEKMAEKLNKHSDIIDKNLKDHNFVDNMTLIRELLFK